MAEKPLWHSVLRLEINVADLPGRCVASVGGVGLGTATLLVRFSGSVAPALPPSGKIFVPKIGLQSPHGDEEDHNVLVPFVADSKVLEAECGVRDLWLDSRSWSGIGECGLKGKMSRSVSGCYRTEEQWLSTSRKNRETSGKGSQCRAHGDKREQGAKDHSDDVFGIGVAEVYGW